MKKMLALLLTIAMLLSFAVNVSAESKTAEASAAGFGGEVRVAVTVEDGKVTAVTAVGESETVGVGSLAINQLPAAMVEAGTVEVDGVSGASVTSGAILEAAKAAYNDAMGVETGVVEVKMVPGTYIGHGTGFSKTVKVPVAVTVNETAIEAIELGYSEDERGAGFYNLNEEVNGETVPILHSVETFMIPRIIEHQSIAVDSVTGATASSGAVKQAVTDALEQALAAAGTDVSAMSAFKTIPEKITGVTETLNYKVVVVGMGGTGSAAAMSAAETMAAAGEEVSILAIDKAGKYGGTSAVTSSPMAINPPRFMTENNYTIRPYQLGPANSGAVIDLRPEGAQYYIDVDVMKAAWLEYTEGDAKEELVDIMMEKSGETLDWLYYEHGFDFGLPQRGLGPNDYYYCVYNYDDSFMVNKHIIDTYFRKIIDDFTKLGGEYMLETEGYGLITDETGKVIGVKARNVNGIEYEIYADSVVLATGGFGGSGEMETKYLSNEYYPLSGEWNLYGMKQNDGKMIQAAIDSGAGTYNIGMSPMTHIGGPKIIISKYEVEKLENGKTRCLNDLPYFMTMNSDTLAVSRLGERFAAETGLSFLESWKAGPYFYSIWDEARVKEIAENGLTMAALGACQNYGGIPAGVAIPEVYDVLDYCIEQGFVYKADTLDEMAEKLGMDAEVLKATVVAYNGYCASGVDEQFGKPAEYLKAIGEGPYYFVTGASYSYSTCGGLDVDVDLRVLAADGETPIEGLYAGGTDCMGVLFSDKKEYVTYGGAAQGWCFTSGKIAGANAASYAIASK